MNVFTTPKARARKRGLMQELTTGRTRLLQAAG
ncbi:MAG: hypothetical protein RL514_4612 [Verrucomicrobiota bacterium]|jgi:hypothetical protein